MEGYSPPSFLVGWKGYPNVYVTPLVSLEKPEVADAPKLWVETGLTIDDILDLRMAMGGGSVRTEVHKVFDPLQELTLSRKPLPVDLYFSKVPKPSPSYGIFPPFGFRGKLERIEVAGSPSTDPFLERIIHEELRTTEAVIELYRKGRDVYIISKAFSAGLLGKERHLVPTRWSITAVDSIIGDALLKVIRENPSINSYMLFHSHLYDNHFFIIFMPGPWAFELVEAWAPKSFWSRGKEIILSASEVGRKRKKYAEETGGSYYASRLAVLEKLHEMKRTASVVILREVHEGYYAPLGVWQVRENVREALKKKPFISDRFKEIVEQCKELGMRVSWEKWKERSVLLKSRQTTLFGN